MEFFDEGFCEGALGFVDDEVDAAKVVGGFEDVVDVEGARFGSDGVGFKDEAGLLVGEAAAFDVVGVVGELDLRFVVDAAAVLGGFFFAEDAQELLFRGFARFARTLGIGGNAPGFALEIGAGHASLSAVIAHAARGKSPFFSHFGHTAVGHATTSSLFFPIIPWHRQKRNLQRFFQRLPMGIFRW